MALTQWNPFSEFVSLREAMDRLFNESLVHPGGALGHAATPPYDVYETEDSLVYRFALPGIRPEDVDITTQQGMLTISGRYPQSEESQSWIWHARGLPQGGTIQFTVSVPTMVDAERAEAQFEHGVLTLTLPKAEAVKPKRIAIAGSSTARNGGKMLGQGRTQSR